MIELRWLKKRPVEVDSFGQPLAALLVLQYRNYMISPYRGENYIYTEWLDIPTVVEDEPKTQIGPEDIT